MDKSLIPAEGFWAFRWMFLKGWTGLPRNKPSDVSISVFGRFTYTPSAMNVHCPDMELMAVCFLDNVRSYHTECS